MTTATLSAPAHPAAAGGRKLLGAHTVDSFGTGLFLAFLVVYFTRTTSLSVAAIGAAISLARLLALPTAIATGPLIDRYGARLVAAGANLLSALAYLGFLGARQTWQIVGVVWLAQVGTAAYWTTSTGLVVLAAEEAERPRWFALVGTLRNGGLALGGAAGALLLAVGSTGGLRIAVLLNAASYLCAALLLARWRPANPPTASSGTASSGTEAGSGGSAGEGGYRTVLSDRRYLLAVGINLGFVFSSMVLSLLIALYFTAALAQPAWTAALMLVVNCAQVVLTQTTVTRRLERYRPIRAIAAGALLNALSFVLFALLLALPGWTVLLGACGAILVYNLAETVATPFRENLSVSLADPALRGRYLAVYQLSWTVGQAVSPALLTLLFGWGPALPWLFLAAVSVVSVPMLLALEKRMTGRYS